MPWKGGKVVVLLQGRDKMDIIDTVRKFDRWVAVTPYLREQGAVEEYTMALDCIELHLSIIAKVEYLTEA